MTHLPACVLRLIVRRSFALRSLRTWRSTPARSSRTSRCVRLTPTAPSFRALHFLAITVALLTLSSGSVSSWRLRYLLNFVAVLSLRVAQITLRDIVSTREEEEAERAEKCVIALACCVGRSASAPLCLASHLARAQTQMASICGAPVFDDPFLFSRRAEVKTSKKTAAAAPKEDEEGECIFVCP
jgi:hypothetical protein